MFDWVIKALLGNDERRKVFVSYSRADLSLVLPIVALLRTTQNHVFIDVDSIQLGKLWEPQLLRSIRNAALVIVFWCRHSAASPWVERELREAIEMRKNVLPLLLDNTPVPEALRKFQTLDFRSLAGHEHGSPFTRFWQSVPIIGTAALWLHGSAIVFSPLLLAASLCYFVVSVWVLVGAFASDFSPLLYELVGAVFGNVPMGFFLALVAGISLLVFLKRARGRNANKQMKRIAAVLIATIVAA
jgi:hypothetical protein